MNLTSFISESDMFIVIGFQFRIPCIDAFDDVTGIAEVCDEVLDVVQLARVVQLGHVNCHLLARENANF